MGLGMLPHVGISSQVAARVARIVTFPPETLFAGTQSLTTSFVEAATRTLDSSPYPIPAGYVRQYRLAYSFAGTVAGADQLEGGELRTANSTYQSAGIVANAGWLDESGGGWWLNQTAAGWSFVGPGVSLDGTTRLLGPIYAPGAFTAECQFTRGRSGTVEAIMSTWVGAAGRWLVTLNSSDKPQLNIHDGTTGFQVVGANAVTGGPHWAAVVSDGATFTHLFIDGTRVATTAHAPNANSSNRGNAFGIGGDGDDNNRFLGTVLQARYSAVARYTGTTYSTPVGNMSADAGTVGLWTFQAAPAAMTVTTGWLPFPASAAATSLRVRNKTAARGTLTGIILEVRATAGKDIEFARYQTTPVISYNSSSYDSSDIAAPYVFLDTPNSRWVCAYSAFDGSLWKLALAYAAYDASDLYQGLGGPWTREPANPVFGPAGDLEGYIACNGWIAYRSGTYFHFYGGGQNVSPFKASVFVASSPDMINWTRLNGGNPVITFNDNGPDQVADPQGFVDADGNFVLWCEVSPSLLTRECWRCISSNGIDWTKQRKFGPPPMSMVNIGEPSPTEVGGVTYLLQDTSDGVPNGGRRILESYSADSGRTWSFRRNRLAESANAWETGQVFDSCRLQVGAKSVLFYAGSVGLQAAQGMHSSIGMAVADWDDGRI